MASRKILIVTYYWPPSGGVGVQRWMNFALRLQEKGWEPIILTPENPQFEIKDEQLVDRVKQLKTYKLPIWEPFQLFHKITGNKERQNVQQGLVMEKGQKSFTDKISVWIRGNVFIPDPRIFWVKKASDFAIDLIEREDISTVITTGPPHSIHLIGRRIKRKTGIKWLADFRDPWSKWDIQEKLKTSYLAMEIHKNLERSVLKESDIALTVSKRMAQSFGGIEVLTNGVTVPEIEEIEPLDEEFLIGYFGMLNELRNPTQLWMLLDQMCRENDAFSEKLKIRIGGIVSESIKEELLKYQELKSKVEFLGYLSHEAIQKEYKKCHLLLLLLNKSNNSEWILPLKLFEYLGAERTILCLGNQKSDLGEIINCNDIGEIFGYSDIELIRGFLEDMFENKRSPNSNDISTLIKEFSHEVLVEKLDLLLKKLNANESANG